MIFFQTRRKIIDLARSHKLGSEEMAWDVFPRDSQGEQIQEGAKRKGVFQSKSLSSQQRYRQPWAGIVLRKRNSRTKKRKKDWTGG